MRIEDGTGEGFAAKVNEENQLLTECVTVTAESHTNRHEAEAYHVLFDNTPDGAGDCFFYMKNLDDIDIIIEGVWFRVASTEKVQIKLGDVGTLIGGTTITPVNCNAGSGNVADGTFCHSSDMTGLSGGNIVETYWLGSTESKHYNFEQDIVLPKNSVYTMYAVTGDVPVSGTVVFNYHD